MRDFKQIKLWKDVTLEQWNDWKWQVSNRITTLDCLRKVLTLKNERS